MCFLDTLKNLEIWNIWKWDDSGKILIFVNENEVVQAIEKLGKRKITVASFKRNMTMFGFSIVERGQLNYQNPEYTRENRQENIPIIKKRVQEKNKADNDNKKRKMEEKQQQIMHSDAKKALIECDETKIEINADTLKYNTASIIKSLPQSNTSSPLNSFTHVIVENDLILPRITTSSITQNTSISNSTHNSKEDDTELVIDEEYQADLETVSQGSDMNVEDANDEIADTADDAETQENTIDQPIVPVLATQQSNPQEIETRRQSYAMGLQHKHAEYQIMLSIENQRHEKEKEQLKREFEKMIRSAYHKGFQEGLNNATGPILATLFQLNPNVFPKNTKLVNLCKK